MISWNFYSALSTKSILLEERTAQCEKDPNIYISTNRNTASTPEPEQRRTTHGNEPTPLGTRAGRAGPTLEGPGKHRVTRPLPLCHWLNGKATAARSCRGVSLSSSVASSGLARIRQATTKSPIVAGVVKSTPPVFPRFCSVKFPFFSCCFINPHLVLVGYTTFFCSWVSCPRQLRFRRGEEPPFFGAVALP